MRRQRFEKKSKKNGKPFMKTSDPAQWNALLREHGLGVLDTRTDRPPPKRQGRRRRR